LIFIYRDRKNLPFYHSTNLTIYHSLQTFLPERVLTSAHLDYEDLKSKAFFPGLINYMASGPVVAFVIEGLDAVKTGRVMLGATNPLASVPGKYINIKSAC
jgi:nucleoside diphosphate kinase